MSTTSTAAAKRTPPGIFRATGIRSADPSSLTTTAAANRTPTGIFRATGIRSADPGLAH
ncbi:MAG TPA: hypothetical protein VI540_10030 [Gaiellaceae bacterium]|nr:hypothetical protein [Gaiellaceae bacterium]